MKTKELILDSALKLFAKKGYEAVSVAEIADAVGVKAPSLYKHYKSKQDIFDSIIQRINELDYEKAQDYDMPSSPAAEDSESYGDISPENIGVYAKAMLLHWTSEEFTCNFRRMLTLEQYKTPKMNELYQNYIAGGPVNYMADIFFGFSDISKSRAYEYAVEFYAPMYLMYSLYDSGADVKTLTEMLERHTEKFIKRLNIKRRDQL